MNKKLIKIIGILILVIFAILLVLNTNFVELYDSIKKVSIYIILLLIVLQIITQLLLGLQWNKLSKVILGKSSFFKMLYILTTGSVVEALTPGAKIGGEVTRLFYLKKEFNASTEDASNIIIIQKSISMSVLFSICLLSFIYLCSTISMNLSIFVQILIYVLSLFLILLMISFLFFSKKLSILLDKSSNKYFIKINKHVTNYSSSTSMLSKKQWVSQFIISSFVWILFPLKMAILVSFMNIEINFLVVIAITMSSYMISTLPITPGGIGTFEGTMISLFSIVDISSALSTTITVVFRIITFWFVMLLSVIYASVYKRGEKDVETDS